VGRLVPAGEAGARGAVKPSACPMRSGTPRRHGPAEQPSPAAINDAPRSLGADCATVTRMETHLCVRWTAAAMESPKLPALASRWKSCPDRTIDQEALARAWGLLEGLDQPPPPNPSISFRVQIR
jgi:hypothetical protein